MPTAAVTVAVATPAAVQRRRDHLLLDIDVSAFSTITD
jgi:hypothetical protein